MDTGSSYGKTDVQRNSSYATLASYKTGSSMTREQRTYEGYQTERTSDIRRTIVDNLRFLTIYNEVDVRNTWYYNYTKTLTDLYPDGTIIPSTERTVADEQVQYIEDGISQWTEYKSASQLAEENMLYLSQHYKIPDYATFTSMSTWAVGSYEAIFYDEPLTRSDYMELFKNEEQSL
uniref:hypothetical protein n=1 Tax=Ornithinibacillus contaminans TaxID=694055 RepID=UPI0012EE71B1